MLRIVAGKMGGRRIDAPPGRQTRPTAERVREAVFNVLRTQISLEGVQVLDLFAGSGALGIEALSRGAAFVTFVESHGRTAGVIRGNLKALDVPSDQARVLNITVESWLGREGSRKAVAAPAALVLADPPYGYAGHQTLLAALAESPAVANDAVIVLESAKHQTPESPAGLAPLQTKRYGDTQVSYYRKTRVGQP